MIRHLQEGDADLVYVPPDFIDQLTSLTAISCAWNAEAQKHECVDVEGAEDQPLIVYYGHPTTSRADMFFVWNVVH